MNQSRSPSTQSAPAAPAGDARLALVCLGAVPWGRSWKRIQSMVFHLSRRPLFDRVIFVNPNEIWFLKQLTGTARPLRERLQNLGSALPHRVDDRVRVITMAHFLPVLGRFAVARKLEERAFRVLLDRQRDGLPFVLLNNHPNFFSRPLLEDLLERSVLSVYDMSDDFVEYHRDPRHRAVIGASVEFSCRHSDVVFVINEHVREKYGPLNPNTHVIGNCTNFGNFDRSAYREVPFMQAIRALGQPVLGYTGIINSVRVDYDLLTALLTDRPHWQFVFVGSADRSFLDLVKRHSNLHHHPQVDYDLLPDHIAAMDVAIIPFRVNEHTRGNDLLKFNDYLAMGRSIVTTDTGGARKYSAYLRIADGPQAFTRAIEAALAEDRAALAAARKDVARRNSWEHRAQEIEHLLRTYLRVQPIPETATLLQGEYGV